MTRILIIDDQRLLRRIMIRILAGIGHEAVEAKDGREGLTLFRIHRPALVITDIVMPEQEGFQTIRDLRHEAPDVAILAISGGGREQTPMFLIDAGRVGADATLRRPFRPAELIAVVSKLLSRQ
jgi:DNA-binding response OmpR family regulator